MATYRSTGRRLWFEVSFRLQVAVSDTNSSANQTVYHVVFKAEDAVVNVELRQLFFMDADLVLLLDLHYPGLNLLPCCVGEF